MVQLLTIVPYPSEDKRDGWTRGLELVPAGLLAVRHINNTPGLLGEHTLELVVREGEGCGATVIVKDIYSLFDSLEANIAGLVGLPCSTPAGAVSKIAGHSGVNLIQIAGASSPALRNSVTYPRLYRVASSRGIVDSVISFMRLVGWSNVSVFHDEQGLYFKTLAENLVHTVRRNGSGMFIDNVGMLTTLADEAIVKGLLTGADVKRNIVTVVIGTEIECSIFMCSAYQLGRTRPQYVYILPDRKIADFLPTNTCNAQIMTKAIEGVITVNVNQKAADDAVLVSGMTYKDYELEYLQELKDYSRRNSEYNLDPAGTAYANNLYDEVWSFALALNSSLPRLDAMNLSLDNIRLNSGAISDILEQALINVDFQGASGRINFQNDHESITSVSIYQITNGVPKSVATYSNTVLTPSVNVSDLQLPSDHIKRIYLLIPTWTVVMVVSVCTLTLGLIAFNATLLLWFRTEKDIKASSPYLSLLTFIGCTLLTVSAILFVVTSAYNISDYAFAALCNIQVWFISLGFNLIINTLFVRLFRVYRLFQPDNYKKGGLLWSDRSLVMIIILLTSYSAVVNALWLSLDPYRKQQDESYKSQETPPNFEVKLLCSCRFEAFGSRC